MGIPAQVMPWAPAGLPGEPVAKWSHGLERSASGDHAAVPQRQREVNVFPPLVSDGTLLATLVASCADAIIVSDSTGIIRTWNPSAERVFGYTADEAVGQSLEILAVPERREETLKILSRVRAGERLEEFATQRRAKDGRVIETLLTISPIRNPDGEVVGASGIARDVTARREEERAAEEVRDRIAQILESVADAFVAVDDEWRFTYFNAAAERITRLSRSDLVGRILWEIFPDTTGTVIEQELRRCAAEQIPTEFEVFYPRFDGWFQVRSFPSAAGGIAIYVLDVTAAKAAQDERERLTRIIRENEERWRFLANALPQFVWITEHEGEAEFINDYWFDYTGQPRDALSSERWSAAIHPDDGKTIAEMWERARATCSETAFEYRIRRADGEWRWHYGIHKPDFDATGKVRRWVGFGFEIHDRKETEAALRRANTALEQFAYAAAHDLQEPVRNMVIYAQVLAKMNGALLDEKSAESIRFIVEGSLRIETLIRDLLSYTSITSDDAADGQADCDADAVLHETLENLRTAIEEAGAVVTAEQLPRVGIRHSHLLQVLQNLISNSLKYRGVDEPRIWVSALRQGADWVFTVEDNGQGISPEHHERIFRVFKRLHGRDVPGTGIGLALCERIVDHYGGRIWVESDEGHGAAFKFTLPPSRRES